MCVKYIRTVLAISKLFFFFHVTFSSCKFYNWYACPFSKQVSDYSRSPRCSVPGFVSLRHFCTSTAFGVRMDELWRVLLRQSWSIVCDKHGRKPMFWNVIPCSAGAGWYHRFCGICWAEFSFLETEIFPLLCVVRGTFIWEGRWHLWEPLCPHFTFCPSGWKAFDPWCTITECEKLTVYKLLAKETGELFGSQ